MKTHGVSVCSGCSDGDGVERTAFTERNYTTGRVTRSAGRPALLLSSTSWTGQYHLTRLNKAYCLKVLNERLGLEEACIWGL